MGAKSVIRDVGRVMGFSYGESDRLAKMIPNELGITLAGFDKRTRRQDSLSTPTGRLTKSGAKSGSRQ